ncbi:hypothetical protein B0H19DRAFT_1089178 [Mycena capillaripes]|nr:hypothetical protein B0H19DRAFT_1089178 [Mycena capillaripes]
MPCTPEKEEKKKGGKKIGKEKAQHTSKLVLSSPGMAVMLWNSSPSGALRPACAFVAVTVSVGLARAPQSKSSPCTASTSIVRPTCGMLPVVAARTGCGIDTARATLRAPATFRAVPGTGTGARWIRSSVDTYPSSLPLSLSESQSNARKCSSAPRSTTAPLGAGRGFAASMSVASMAASGSRWSSGMVLRRRSWGPRGRSRGV